jgi:hypothetical protein
MGTERNRKETRKGHQIDVLVDVLPSFDDVCRPPYPGWGGGVAEFSNVRELREGCEYETLLIENVPAVYNSPCMCYPLYNILLNKYSF